MHKEHNTKNFDNKKEKQGFHLSQIEKKKFDNV